MTSRAKAAAAFTGLAVAGVAAVSTVQFTGSTAAPKGVISQAARNGCHDVPGKFWGGAFHYSAAILRPTRIETYCVSYPDGGGTLARVSYRPVAP